MAQERSLLAECGENIRITKAMTPLKVTNGAAVNSSTTTISTIAVQSGRTRVVLATLLCGDTLSLKVVEMEPGVGFIASTLQMAAELQAEHTDVLRRLRSKQNPVEDLLRQADDLIANQKSSKAQVYAAMAQSLGLAWKDLIDLMDERKAMLDQCFIFYSHLNEFWEKSDEIEKLSKVDNVVDLSNGSGAVSRSLKGAKKAMLETSVFALQEAEVLSEKLNRLWNMSYLDVRPSAMKKSIGLAMDQVDNWLERLHDRRVHVTFMMDQRLAGWAQDEQVRRQLGQMDDLEKVINDRKASLMDKSSWILGPSLGDVENLVRVLRTLQAEADTLTEHCTGFVKQCQVSGSSSSSTKLSVKAYNLLEMLAEYQKMLELRDKVLGQTKDYFLEYESISQRLDEMHRQFRQGDLDGEDSLIRLDAFEEALKVQEGRILTLKDSGAAVVNLIPSSAVAVAAKEFGPLADDLVAKVADLRSLVELEKFKASSHHEAMRDLKLKLEHISSWSNDMAKTVQTVLEAVKDLTSARQLAKALAEWSNQLKVKGLELAGVRQSLEALLSSSAKTKGSPNEINEACQETQAGLQILDQSLEARASLSDKLVRFWSVHDQLAELMEGVENQLLESIAGDDRPRLELEGSRLAIQQLIMQACNLGENLLEESHGRSSSDPFGSIQAAMSNLRARQRAIDELLAKAEFQYQEGLRMAEEEEEWHEVVKDANEAMDALKDVDAQLFPLIGSAKGTPVAGGAALRLLEERASNLPKVALMPDRLDRMVGNVEDVLNKVQHRASKDKKESGRKIVQQMRDEHQSLKFKLGAYETLLQMTMSLCRKLKELDNWPKDDEDLPKGLVEVEAMTREHGAFRESRNQLLAAFRRELQSLEDKVRAFFSGPKFAACNDLLQVDLDSLRAAMEASQAAFDRSWNRRHRALAKQGRLCRFSSDLKRLTREIEAVSDEVRQKTAVEETRASVASSAARLESIGSNNLGSAIAEFLEDGQRLAEDLPEHHASLEASMEQLRGSWGSLQKLIGQQDEKLRAASEYFDLMDQSERFLKEANKSFLNLSQMWASSSRGHQVQHGRRRPDEDDVKRTKDIVQEYFQSYDEVVRNDVLDKMAAAAGRAFGSSSSACQKAQVIHTEHRDTFEAFNALLKDVSTLEAKSCCSGEVDSAGSKTWSSHETQTDQEPEAPPYFVRPLPRRLEVPAGSKVVLECTIASTGGNLEVEWFVDDVAVVGGDPPVVNGVGPSSIGDVVHFDGGRQQGHRLILHKVTPAAAGHNSDHRSYCIRARNRAGEIRSSCTVSVKGAEPKVTRPKFAPGSIRGPGVAEEGVKVVLEAIFSQEGGPQFAPPKVLWLHNQSPVQPTQDVRIEVTPQSTTLKFSKVKEHHAGQYTCVMQNQGGRAKASTDLKVLPKKALPPVFLKKLNPSEALDGSEVVVEVEIGGVPQPQVTWLRNGVPLRPQGTDGGLRLEKQGPCHTLTLPKATVKDSGTYSVVAMNSAGRTECEAEIRVVAAAAPVPVVGPVAVGPPPRPPLPNFGHHTFPRSPRRPSKQLSESLALSTLAGFRRQPRRPLPELVPFPFAPDNLPPAKPRSRSQADVRIPTPSKFSKGQMRHSDYEPDWGGPIRPMWKSPNGIHGGHQDQQPSYRRVKAMTTVEPQDHRRQRPPRQASPPCPHVWESHEVIDQLEEYLRRERAQSRQSMESLRSFWSKTSGVVVSSAQRLLRDQGATTTTSKLGHPRNAKGAPGRTPEPDRGGSTPTPTNRMVGTGVAAPPAVRGSTPNNPEVDDEAGVTYYRAESRCSSRNDFRSCQEAPPGATGVSTDQGRQHHVSVREKVKILEKKVDEEYLKSLAAATSESQVAEPAPVPGDHGQPPPRATPSRFRPEEIPGAVRVFPPSPVALGRCRRGLALDSARFMRSQSLDTATTELPGDRPPPRTLGSPLTLPRQQQQQHCSAAMFRGQSGADWTLPRNAAATATTTNTEVAVSTDSGKGGRRSVQELDTQSFQVESWSSSSSMSRSVLIGHTKEAPDRGDSDATQKRGHLQSLTQVCHQARASMSETRRSMTADKQIRPSWNHLDASGNIREKAPAGPAANGEGIRDPRLTSPLVSTKFVPGQGEDVAQLDDRGGGCSATEALAERIKAKWSPFSTSGAPQPQYRKVQPLVKASAI